MSDGRRYGTTVRRAPGSPAPAAAPGVTLAPPAVPAAVAEPAPPAAGPQVYESVTDRFAPSTGGRPRTQGRPQPEYPLQGYAPYRLLGRLPAESPWWRRRLVDWLLGHPSWLLYIGITCRTGFVRWAEHSDVKTWAGDVDECEIIPDEHWATLHDTVIDSSSSRPFLVFDAAAIADDGIRPIRPGEAIDTEPHFREVHGELVEVYYLDDETGIQPAGLVVEGARTGEKRLIQAWDGGPRPIHNIEHNEGEHATNRVRRHFPRLTALARRQALALVAVWLLVGIGLAFIPFVPGWLAALLAGCLLQAAQVVRLALTGFPKRRRRHPRKPRGRKRWQRRKRHR